MATTASLRSRSPRRASAPWRSRPGGSVRARRRRGGERDPAAPRRRSPWPAPLGAGEGQVNIIAWAGYAEDGTNDKTVDWVHPFEKATGCKVNVKIANTSDEMVTLMKTGQYDGVSASGDATLRLIYGGDVAPVNTALVPNYATIFAVPQGPALELGR